MQLNPSNRQPAGLESDPSSVNGSFPVFRALPRIKGTQGVEAILVELNCCESGVVRRFKQLTMKRWRYKARAERTDRPNGATGGDGNTPNRPALSSNGADPRIQTHASKKKHTYVWQCCYCGYPSIPYRSTACPSCGYGRCGNCSITKIQVR